VGYPKAKRAKKAQTVLNKFNKIIKQIITFKKPFFTLVNLNRIGWSISPDYTTNALKTEKKAPLVKASVL